MFKPDPTTVRQQAQDLFDEITVPILADVPPKFREQYRRMFAEGYLQGYSNGATEALTSLLPSGPGTPVPLQGAQDNEGPPRVPPEDPAYQGDV